jgi:signal transduction histidine kinase
MRNWRLRTKVVAVIIVPTITALILVGLRAKGDLDSAAQFQYTVDQVDFARNVTTLVHELQQERALAVAGAASANTTQSPELEAQISRVDDAVRTTQDSAANLETDDEAAKQRYATALQRLSALTSVRNAAAGAASAYPDIAVHGAYSAVLDPLIRLGLEINLAVSDRALLREGTVVQSLSEAKESLSKENSILQIAAANAAFTPDLLRQLRGAESSFATALANYRANASLDQLQLYSDTVTGPEVDARERIKYAAVAAAEEQQTAEEPQPLVIDGPALVQNGTVTLDRLRTVEQTLLENLRNDADQRALEATESAWRDSAIVLAALLVALGLTALVTSSLLRPLRMLRREALEVANRRLPASVQRILADPDPAEAAKRAVEPVAVFTTEETGQLARSFDAVQDQAIRMATEQALLRDNINSIFVNLSRRSQTLVERQLALIDRLEQDEQDPDQLASLFELDHLATRMRRNSESLLVLSGTGLSRQLNRPVPAAEVVGAAVSEVEQYARIEVASAPDVAVQGRAVSDLVHVIAELLDNATYFSEPEKKVIVRMAMTRGRELAIQITDQGVGMTEDEIAAANERLADPPDLDVAVTRRMGLYVVARLAKRHDIQVRLRDNEDIDGGLIARINVPSELVQPLARSATTTSGTMSSSDIHAALSTTGTSTALSAHTPPPAARNSGIAGAFTGNMPRARDKRPGEQHFDRTPEEVAGYPPFSHDSAENGSANGSVAAAEPEPVQNGTYEEPGSLFGSPLPDPGPPSESETTGSGYFQPPAPEAAELNVDAPTERLPIYEAVLSQWFEAADTGSMRSGAPGETNGHAEANGTAAADEVAEEAPAAEPEPPVWTSPADDGWQAAQALLNRSAPDTTTEAGLPKRVRGAQLVPGSAQPRHALSSEDEEPAAAGSAPSAPAPPPLPPRSADAVRGRMSSFQQGVRRGRHALIEAYAGEQSGSEQSRRDEEQE